MHRNVLSRHGSSPARWSRLSAVIITCNKGFGGAKQKGTKAGQAKIPARTAEQAADLAEAAANSPKVRPINSKEAARGKVDYVQVKDWADGRAADLGELQVLPDSYTAEAYTVGGGDNTAGPFYQQLAHHARYLESQGALTVALEPGAKPFLPFESWQYTVPRYRQYLAELATVHEALEEALLLALSTPPATAASTTQSPRSQAETESSTDSAGSKHDSSSSSNNVASSTASSTSQGQAAPWDVPGRSAVVSSAYAALNCYGPDCGLWRAAAAAADFTKLIELAIAYNKEHARQQQQHESATSPRAQVKLHASQNAVAYGRYLLQLGRSAAAATAAAASAAQSTNGKRSSSSILVSEEDEGQLSVLKLLAHAYAIHVQQQCLGTRIGAAATDHLGLMAVGVTALYLDYPPNIEEPVKQLMAVTDAAGKCLDAAGKQSVFDELPKALKKATLLLAPLATP